MIMGNLSVSVAEGTKAFGRFDTSKSGVAYADMEQGEEFAQARWNAILGGRRVNGVLRTFFEWDRIGEGCIKNLREYLYSNPTTRLFVIDILANVWPAKDLVSGTVYQKEYAIISQLAKVAKEFNVSIVGVHHKSKHKGTQDNVMQASGSVGIVAAADVIWSLSRERDNPYAFLHVSGKNVENRAIRLLNTEGFKWTA
jgi:RecA-family ATPase